MSGLSSLCGWHRDFRFVIEGNSDSPRLFLHVYAPDWVASVNNGSGHFRYDLSNPEPGACRYMAIAEDETRRRIDELHTYMAPLHAARFAIGIH